MQIKFVDLNIWLGGKLFDEVLTFLKEEKPDILTLQEVYSGTDPSLPRANRTMEVLAQELDLPHSTFVATHQDSALPSKVDRGNAIFSRYPIEETWNTFFDVPYGAYQDGDPKQYPFFPRNLHSVRLNANGKTINVFNTQGVWGLDGEDSERRLKMGQIILAAIKGKENVILSGDFNMEANTKSLLPLEEHLTNVFKNELKTSFNMRRKDNPGYATAVVDMVYVSKNIEVLEHSCPDVDISDHLPLVCKFNLS